MNTKQLDTEIRSRIDEFLVSISGLVRQAAVEAVREALGADSGAIAGAGRGPGRPRKTDSARPVTMAVAGRVSRGKATKPGRRTRRSSTDVEAVGTEVLAYVKTNPGSRLEEIGRGLKTDTAGLKLPVKELVTSGRLRTEGQKRGTKYFAEGKTAGAKVKAKAPARKGAQRKAGQRSKQTAVRQAVVNPAKKAAKRPAARGGATKAVTAEAEPVTAA